MDGYAKLSKRIYTKAVADSGCKQFIAETKILLPGIDKILMRAIEVMTDKLPAINNSESSLVAYLLVRTRDIYNEKYRQWHSQKIVIAEVFCAVASGIEQVVSLALQYKIKLKGGRLWSFNECGPLLAVYDEIVSVTPPLEPKCVSGTNNNLHAFLFTQSDLRMIRPYAATAGERG